MATFNAPPMPAAEWEAFYNFNKQVIAETGASFIDMAALRMIRQYAAGPREPTLNSATVPLSIE